MDYTRVVWVYPVLFLVIACVHEAPSPARPLQSYFESEAGPSKLFKLTEQYLEWHAGFPIQLRDPQRGLLVTEWVLNSPHERERMTIKITPRIQGSLFSTFIQKEKLVGVEWQEMLANSVAEDQWIRKFQDHLKNIQYSAGREQ